MLRQQTRLSRGAGSRECACVCPCLLALLRLHAATRYGCARRVPLTCRRAGRCSGAGCSMRARRLLVVGGLAVSPPLLLLRLLLRLHLRLLMWLLMWLRQRRLLLLLLHAGLGLLVGDGWLQRRHACGRHICGKARAGRLWPRKLRVALGLRRHARLCARAIPCRPAD